MMPAISLQICDVVGVAKLDCFAFLGTVTSVGQAIECKW
jgi:hypothetical protein